MLFNSITFVVFFIVVTTLYFLLNQKYRWLLLLVASCYFYMAFVPIYIIILGGTIIVDYFAGIYIENANGARRKFFLTISLIANIGVLCVFKYYNFLNENLSALLSYSGHKNPFPFLTILLPIGLSFHTFQAMSYTIEVYRGNQAAERNFGVYALYVMFYPQLVAGPIERPQNLLHQFYEKHNFDSNRVSAGLKQMMVGFLKKLVVADRLSLYVDTIYGSSSTQSGKSLLVATVFFAIQIYCDFSGYSDIAIGAAKVMGFDLMKNFNRPYFSLSISEFWRRWHISLSTWFKDYLYFPLGGSRVANIYRRYFNLLVVFLVSGLWHGANWTFVIWGALNGCLLIIESALKIPFTTTSSWKKILRTVITFSLICLTWVFFRATTAAQAIAIVGKIIQFKGPLYLGNPKDHFLYSVTAAFSLLIIEFLREYYPRRFELFDNKNAIVRYAVYAAAIVVILLFGVLDGGQFIYFQF